MGYVLNIEHSFLLHQTYGSITSHKTHVWNMRGRSTWLLRRCRGHTLTRVCCPTSKRNYFIIILIIFFFGVEVPLRMVQAHNIAHYTIQTHLIGRIQWLSTNEFSELTINLPHTHPLTPAICILSRFVWRLLWWRDYTWRGSSLCQKWFESDTEVVRFCLMFIATGKQTCHNPLCRHVILSQNLDSMMEFI